MQGEMIVVALHLIAFANLTSAFHPRPISPKRGEGSGYIDWNLLMNVIGADFLRSMLESEGYYLKLILNDRGGHFFPHTIEHRDATLPGLCYKDDSLGNALAGTIKPRQIDLRLHRAFSDARVASIVSRLLEHPDAMVLVGFEVNYCGRTLVIPKVD